LKKQAVSGHMETLAIPVEFEKWQEHIGFQVEALVGYYLGWQVAFDAQRDAFTLIDKMGQVQAAWQDTASGDAEQAVAASLAALPRFARSVSQAWALPKPAGTASLVIWAPETGQVAASYEGYLVDSPMTGYAPEGQVALAICRAWLAWQIYAPGQQESLFDL
jgi:hypothetical protein